MDRLVKLLVVLFVLASLIPAWYANRWLQLVIQPRRSFIQLLLYIVAVFVLVFAYTFLVVYIIYHVFPVPKR